MYYIPRRSCMFRIRTHRLGWHPATVFSILIAYLMLIHHAKHCLILNGLVLPALLSNLVVISFIMTYAWRHFTFWNTWSLFVGWLGLEETKGLHSRLVILMKGYTYIIRGTRRWRIMLKDMYTILYTASWLYCWNIAKANNMR